MYTYIADCNTRQSKFWSKGQRKPPQASYLYIPTSPMGDNKLYLLQIATPGRASSGVAAATGVQDMKYHNLGLRWSPAGTGSSWAAATESAVVPGLVSIVFYFLHSQHNLLIQGVPELVTDILEIVSGHQIK